MRTVQTDEGKLPLSEKFYLTFGGNCTQVPVRPDGTSTEWPYDLADMTECKQDGKHPHISEAKGRRRKQK